MQVDMQPFGYNLKHGIQDRQATISWLHCSWIGLPSHRHAFFVAEDLALNG